MRNAGIYILGILAVDRRIHSEHRGAVVNRYGTGCDAREVTKEKEALHRSICENIDEEISGQNRRIHVN